MSRHPPQDGRAHGALEAHLGPRHDRLRDRHDADRPSSREKHKAAFEERAATKLTYMPFIVQGRASTPCKAYPDRQRERSRATTIVYHRDINIGIAVALDWGLIVPVIQNADEKNVLGLAAGRQRPGRPRARTRSSSPRRSRAGRSRSPTPASSAACSARRSSTSRRWRSSASARSRSGRWCANDAIAIRTDGLLLPDLRPPPGGRRRRRPLHGAGQGHACRSSTKLLSSLSFRRGPADSRRSAVRTSSERQVLARGDRRSPVVTRTSRRCEPTLPRPTQITARETVSAPRGGSRAAMSSDGFAAIVDLGQVGVVASARERDVGDRVVTAVAKRAPVVELEPLARRAPSPLFVLVAASASVPLVHGSLHRGRDLARRRGDLALGERLPRLLGPSEAAGFEPLELLGDGLLDDRGRGRRRAPRGA